MSTAVVTGADIEAAYSRDRNDAAAQFFEWHAAGQLAPAQLKTWALEFWRSAEWPAMIAADAGLGVVDIVAMFRAAGFVSDAPDAAPPTAPVTVYRGCTEHGAEGFSWTTDPETARWFAKREALFDREPEEYGAPVILAATIAPEHILATGTGRPGELEVIIDPIGAAADIRAAVCILDLDTPDIPAAVAAALPRR